VRQLPAEERFWAKVDRDGPVPITRPDLGPCALWTGGTYGSNGYGAFSPRRGEKWSAHAYAWMLAGKEVPRLESGLQLDHVCHSVDRDYCTGPVCPHRLCVVVAHLEVVTAGENTLRSNNLAAINARKTRCKRDHPLEGDNLYIEPATGARVCRACRRERQRVG
jgi:hypothetical protein